MDIFIIGAASRRDFVRLRRSRRRRRLPGAGPIGPTGPPRDINIDENDAFIPRTTSPSAVKKPEDLSGRGLPTTAISERIVHQVESGSGFPRSSFGPITSRESLYYVSLILYYVYLLLSFFFTSFSFSEKSNRRDERAKRKCTLCNFCRKNRFKDTLDAVRLHRL